MAGPARRVVSPSDPSPAANAGRGGIGAEPRQNETMKRTYAAALILVLTLAACSGGDTQTDDSVATLETTASTVAGPTTTAAPIDMEAAALEAVACFREQGVDLPDPAVDADGNVQFSQDIDPSTLDEDALAAAQAACAEELSRVITGFIGTDLTGFQDGLLEYAQCMRDNGFDLPDPDFSNFASGGAAAGPFGDIDPEDPDFVAANTVCEDILADITPGG